MSLVLQLGLLLKVITAGMFCHNWRLVPHEILLIVNIYTSFIDFARKQTYYRYDFVIGYSRQYGGVWLL